jgi:uncharacterized protein involved in exopolysaccharide biosynthesis
MSRRRALPATVPLIVQQENTAGPATIDQLAQFADGWSPERIFAALVASWRRLLLTAGAGALLFYGVSHLLSPTYTARTTLLPPQQQQGAAAAALANLGGLAALAGGAGSVKSPAEQYVALMQSNNVRDKLIEEFKLVDVYGKKLLVDTRERLGQNTRIAVGRKDGLISVEVDDESAERAAALANRYVAELRRLTSQLAMTEAQQRRVFFEGLMRTAQEDFKRAQQALQATGFSAGALQAEPRAAAEGYARLKSEVVAADVRLQTLRGTLTDSAPEVQLARSALEALRRQLERLERSEVSAQQPDYIGRYRDFKYQEALLDLFSRQYEMARVDESREGALIQVVDAAAPPERRSGPSRLRIALLGLLVGAVSGAAWICYRHAVKRS